MDYSKFLSISISGGRSSAYSAYLILNNPKIYNYEKIIFIFANTGQERKETIDYLKNCEKYWGIKINVIEGDYSNPKKVGYKDVTWDSMRWNSEPFEECIEYMQRNSWCGVPNEAIPYCSTYLKTRPIRAKAKSIFKTVKYAQCIGMRGEDMPKRITLSILNELNGKIICPLLTHYSTPVYLRDLDYFWNQQPFKLEINSRFGNCKLCYKKSIPNLVETINKTDVASTVKWYSDMEAKYGNTFFRNRMSIGELVKIAEDKSIQQYIDFDDPCFCGF
ncbi:phosphoadenosine phosphosulfate reductase [Candidatus Atribacteria bacterium HGW-Atribacteria-1]|jgi:hypothetical protein|nr:MAG: phosphoadenosine phosphosulfate reductase [Candidatus Atribacteria bacterium HGW-Atribacteria-1]